MDMNTAWLQFAISVSTVGGAILTLRAILAPSWKKFKSFTDSWEVFMRDWAGEPARPGHDAEPGVMERLNKMDGQFKNNGGSSMKDAVDRIERKLSAIDERLDAGNRRFDALEKKVNKDG